MIRRWLAFLFRHEWDTSSTRLVRPTDLLSSDFRAGIRCQKCGEVRMFPAFDFPAFQAIYRKRGCPGPPRKDET